MFYLEENAQNAATTAEQYPRLYPICADTLPCGPRPVLQAHGSAPVRIVGQAPGCKLHEEPAFPGMIRPATAARLVCPAPEQFHHSRQLAIFPMGFCYPGKTASGDDPSRPE